MDGEEEPYNTTILVTLDIHEKMETPPATKVQSSACLLGSSFVFIFRSPLGIMVGGGQHNCTVGGHDVHLSQGHKHDLGARGIQGLGRAAHDGEGQSAAHRE